MLPSPTTRTFTLSAIRPSLSVYLVEAGGSRPPALVHPSRSARHGLVEHVRLDVLDVDRREASLSL